MRIGSRIGGGAGWLLALTLCGVPARAQDAAPKPKLAVLDLADKGVGADVASLLTGVVSNQLSEIGVFEVISRDDIKNLLTHEQDKMLLGCTDASCLADIGGALGVDNLIAGEVGLVGKKYVIGLQRLDVRAAKVAKRTERQFEGSRERLLDEVATAAYKVVEDVLVARSGTVLLSVSEAGADITVDGKTVGTSPLGQLQLPAGPRDVRVAKQGFVHWSRTIQVQPRGTQMVEVSLIPSAAFIEDYESRASSMRVWAWITLGTFVALEAGAAGLRTYTYLKYDPIVDDFHAGDFGGLTEREYWEKYHADIERADTMDYVAMGLAITGVVAGALSLYFFLEGDDPDRYERFRGFQGTMVPAGGGASYHLSWEF